MSKNNTGNDFNSITEELVTRITLDSMGKNKEGILFLILTNILWSFSVRE